MLSSRPISVHTDGPSHAPSKTPARVLPKGRNALQENAAYHAAVTGTTRGKKTAVQHTPFHTRSLKHQGITKGLAHSTFKSTRTAVSRPLVDKTPFANRPGYSLHTPHPTANKIPKLSLLDPDLALAGATPGVNLRPSSTRRSLRLPRLSGGSASSDKFRTPLTTGNHWDVSDGDLELQGVNEEAEAEAVETEDYDEIEYMPPTAIIPPYEPPFELPDYKALGKALLEVAHSYPYDDAPPPDIDLDVYDENFLISTGAKWEKMELPELEDDNPFLCSPTPKPDPRSTFGVGKTPSTSQPKGGRVVTTKPVTKPPIPTTRSSARTATASQTSVAGSSRARTASTTAGTKSSTRTTTTVPKSPAITAAPIPAPKRQASRLISKPSPSAASTTATSTTRRLATSASAYTKTTAVAAKPVSGSKNKTTVASTGVRRAVSVIARPAATTSTTRSRSTVISRPSRTTSTSAATVTKPAITTRGGVALTTKFTGQRQSRNVNAGEDGDEVLVFKTDTEDDGVGGEFRFDV